MTQCDLPIAPPPRNCILSVRENYLAGPRPHSCLKREAHLDLPRRSFTVALLAARNSLWHRTNEQAEEAITRLANRYLVVIVFARSR